MHTFRRTVRALLRSPAESALAAATMAIAIGANTAIFSVVYATVLKPLPYPGSGSAGDGHDRVRQSSAERHGALGS